MNLSRDELIAYAAPYVSTEEISRFVLPGDLFCLMARQIPEDCVLQDDEGWQFASYGVCTRYLLDQDAKPEGKWIWFEFVSLITFPPQISVLKLQPPHIVRGRFHSPTRTEEFRLFALPTTPDQFPPALEEMLANLGQVTQSDETDALQEESPPDNIVQFPSPPSNESDS